MQGQTEVLEQATAAPIRMQGTIQRINEKGYAFVQEQHTREEFWLHVKDFKGYPRDWQAGVLVEFTPGSQQPGRRNRPCLEASVVPGQDVGAKQKRKK